MKKKKLSTAGLFSCPGATPTPCNPLKSFSSYISYPPSLFLDWRRTVSSKFFDTQVSSVFTEDLVLPCHVCWALSRLYWNGYSLLLTLISLESRILHAAPTVFRPRTYLISFYTVQLRTLRTVRSLATFCLSTTSNLGHGKLLGFWGSMVFHHVPISWEGTSNNTNNANHSIHVICDLLQ